MSHPDRVRAASFKPAQLGAASRFGFEVPPTCVTHQPRAAEFIRRHGGRVVAKVVGSGAPSTPGIEPYNVFAHIVGPADLDDQQLHTCPVILQRVIPKKVELRVTVVGDQVLACEIDSQAVEDARVDWRRADTDDVPHRPTSLPPAVEQQCRDFTSSLGLNFAAIDLIRTPEDRFVFVELNPNGQWLWIQDLAGLPIAQKIAAWLAQPTA
jgi:glutathione synthase/RimK-type ligase-like ATP-grasp enzyme